MKVLISRGYGAGWSTWNSGEVAKYMRTYEPIIKALEKGEELTSESPCVEKLVQECKEKFNADYICILGLDGLDVVNVEPSFKIDEYDGLESISTPSDDDWITA